VAETPPARVGAPYSRATRQPPRPQPTVTDLGRPAGRPGSPQRPSLPWIASRGTHVERWPDSAMGTPPLPPAQTIAPSTCRYTRAGADSGAAAGSCSPWTSALVTAR
jgi:hypothetical protein